MKYLKTILPALAVTILGSTANANSYMRTGSNEYYYGANGQYNVIAPRQEYKDFFKKYHPGADLYLGCRFNRALSLELGYAWSSRVAKETTFAVGQTTLNNALTLDQASTATGKIRYRSTHFDLNGYYPIGSHVDGIVSVGVGFLRPNVKVSLSNAAANLNPEVANMSCNTNAMMRLGLGFEGMFGDYWGLRSIVRYENTGRTQVRNAGVGGSKVWSDSMSVGLGFYRYLD